SETPAYAFRAELAKVTQPNRQLEAIKSELAKGQIAHSDSQEDTFETFRSLDFIPDEEDLARGCPLPTNAQSDQLHREHLAHLMEAAHRRRRSLVEAVRADRDSWEWEKLDP
ncbi:unnamed protein product, partial [Polarella glacialis]